MEKNNSIGKNKYMSSVSVFRCIGAFLVMCSHTSYAGSMTFIGNIIDCAVPYFWFAAGFFSWATLQTERKKKIGKHLKKTCIAFCVGYLFYYFLSVWVKYALNGLFNLNMNVSFENWSLGELIYGLVMGVDPFASHLWFIYCLCIVYFCMLLLYRDKMKYVGLVICIGLLCCYQANVFQVETFATQYKAIAYCLPLFYIGYMLHSLYEDYGKKLEDKYNVLFIICCGLAGIWILKQIFLQGTGINISYYELVAFGVLCFSVKYPKFGANTILDKVGSKYSLDIYIYHIFIMHMLQRIFNKVNLLDNTLMNEVFVVLVFVCTIVFAVVKNEAMKRIVDYFKRRQPKGV